MQQRKFYGRTINNTMARIRREWGEQAVVLETRTVEPGSAAARMNPGARVEITVAREVPAPAVTNLIQNRKQSVPANSQRPLNALLQDLGTLRAQIHELLTDASPEQQLRRANLDLAEYRRLIELGVDHRMIAEPFRRWLQWRTASPALRAYIRRTECGPAVAMQSSNLSEWLMLTWLQRQGLETPETPTSAPVCEAAAGVVMIGSTGAGKTTTLAKLASKIRQEKRRNPVVLTLDTQRFGAVEQWRRLGRLIDVPVREIVSQTDLTSCIESLSQFDWIGVDMPGGLDQRSEAARMCGVILAEKSGMTTCLALPATQDESVSRMQIERSKGWGAARVVVTKLDETSMPGKIANLTMDGICKVDGFAMGQRVPTDWAGAGDGRTFRERVLGDVECPETLTQGVA